MRRLVRSVSRSPRSITRTSERGSADAATRLRKPRTRSNGKDTRRHASDASSDQRSGAGRGSQRGGASTVSVGVIESSTFSRSTLDMPSIMQ